MTLIGGKMALVKRNEELHRQKIVRNTKRIKNITMILLAGICFFTMGLIFRHAPPEELARIKCALSWGMDCPSTQKNAR